MTPYIFHLSIFGVATIVALFMYMNTLRIRAKFDLYKIRDELIYLVATGKLKEDDDFFQFFYRSTNNLLREAPNVGLDVILQDIPTENEKNKSKAHTEKILSDSAMEHQEVRNVVSDYFRAVIVMVLSHSSVTRFFYVVALRVVAPVNKLFNPQFIAIAAITAVSTMYIVPGTAKRGLDAIKHVEEAQLKVQHADI